MSEGWNSFGRVGQRLGELDFGQNDWIARLAEGIGRGRVECYLDFGEMFRWAMGCWKGLLSGGLGLME